MRWSDYSGDPSLARSPSGTTAAAAATQDRKQLRGRRRAAWAGVLFRKVGGTFRIPACAVCRDSIGYPQTFSNPLVGRHVSQITMAYRGQLTHDVLRSAGRSRPAEQRFREGPGADVRAAAGAEDHPVHDDRQAICELRIFSEPEILTICGRNCARYVTG
jgi:hypothetical protein